MNQSFAIAINGLYFIFTSALPCGLVLLFASGFRRFSKLVLTGGQRSPMQFGFLGQIYRRKSTTATANSEAVASDSQQSSALAKQKKGSSFKRTPSFRPKFTIGNAFNNHGANVNSSSSRPSEV